MSTMRSPSSFGFQLDNSGIPIVKASMPILQVRPEGNISAVGVGGTNGHLGGILWDHAADDLVIFVGAMMTPFTPAIRIDMSGNVSILNPIIISGDLDMNGNNILNANDVELNSLTATGGTTITVNDDLDLTTHSLSNVNDIELTTINSTTGNITLGPSVALVIANAVDAQFATMHINSLGGGSALRIHSINNATYSDLQCNNSGGARSTNGTSGAIKAFGDLVNYAFALGPNVIPFNLVISTASTFTLMSGFGTFYGRNWVKTSNLILTYTGLNSQTCFITASVSVQGTNVALDEIDGCVALNPTVNGSGEITAATDLIQVGRVTVNNTYYAGISGSLAFQFVVNTNDTVCFALRNNTAVRNIDYIFNNFTLQMESNGVDTS